MNFYELKREDGELLAKLDLSTDDRATLLLDLSMWEDLSGVGTPPGVQTPPQSNVILTATRRAALGRLLAVVKAVL